MRAKDFITEYDAFDKGSFIQKKILNGKYTLKARAKDKKDGSTVLVITIYDPKNPKQAGPMSIEFGMDGIAGFRFVKRKDGSVASADTYVDAEYQRQGIASEVYKFVKSLGFNVQPSKAQSPQGKAMWKSFTNKGIVEGLDNIPATLYHATYRPLLKSIKHYGLGGDRAQAKWEDSKPGVVYLALDKNVAESYAETSDVVPDEWLDEIVILKISTNGLDKNKFHLDKNVLDNQGDTVEYHGVIPVTNISLIKQDVAEGLEQKYLWHGSRQPIQMLEPRQALDTGGAVGSNQNAIYATTDPKIAISMGMPEIGSDYGHFPNDPQMVLFSGNIRKGKNVYLHKLPFYGPDGKPQFVQGAHDREFYSIPGVKGIKPVEIKAVPVDKYLNLIRIATPKDLELRKKLTEAPLPQDWDPKEIGLDKTFKHRLNYALSRAKRIGGGSSRVAMIIDYEGRPTVLKVAKNKKGLAQNDVEIDILRDGYLGQLPIVIPLIDYDGDHRDPVWIQTELAQKITAPRLIKMLHAPSMWLFANKVRNIMGQRQPHEMNDEQIEAVYFKTADDRWKPTKQDWDIFNEYASEVAALCHGSGLEPGDLTGASNWGVYQGRPVVIDLGLTKDVWDTYYKR